MRTTVLGYSFVKVVNLKPTKGISREHFLFRGLLEITIWDAGGQERYVEKYFTEKQKPLVFGDVEVGIFMADASVVQDGVKQVFDAFLDALEQYSPKLKQVHVFINKVDLEESREDEVFKLLATGLPKERRDACTFSPVSVKEGTAQERLIEILDRYLEISTEERQKRGRIRSRLDKLKLDAHAEVLLFNRPDGLLISSTVGAFDTKPLKFLTFELGTIESNIYSIYNALYELMGRKVSPLNMAAVVYECADAYLVLRELTDSTTLMAITKGKDPKSLPELLAALSDENDNYKALRRDLEWINP
ncbi:MAG: hypothetical protein Kow0069_21750 [Promethearchaeota archaeon]